MLESRQNKKRRANARLSKRTCVGKLLGLGLLTNGDLHIVVTLYSVFFVLRLVDSSVPLISTLSIAGESVSLLVGRNKIAKLSGETVLILIIRTVEVGVTQHGRCRALYRCEP